MYIYMYMYVSTCIHIGMYVCIFSRPAHSARPGLLYVHLWLVKCALGALLQIETPNSKSMTSAEVLGGSQEVLHCTF